MGIGDRLEKKNNTADTTKNIETRNKNMQEQPKKSLKDLPVAELVRVSTGANFYRIAPSLAVQLGVCENEKQYIDARNYNAKKNFEYNMGIQKEILAGKLKDWNLDEVTADLRSKNASDETIKTITEYGIKMGGRTLAAYAKALDSKKLEDMNGLTPGKRMELLQNQLNAVNRFKSQMRSADSRSEIASDYGITQMANVLALHQFDATLKSLSEDLKITVIVTNQEVEIIKKENPDQNKILLEKFGNQDQVDKYIETQLRAEKIYNSQEFKNLSASDQAKFNKVFYDMYVFNGSLDTAGTFQNMWGGALLAYVESKLIKEFYDANAQAHDAVNDAKSRIVSTEVANGYITGESDEGKKDNFAELPNKGDEYEKNLLRVCKPELDNLITSGYSKITGYEENKKYFDDEGKIRKDLPSNLSEARKNDLKRIGKDMADVKQEKMKVGDELILDKANQGVKQQAFYSCIDVLREYMDIPLSEKENFLRDFKIQEDKVEKEGTDMVMKIAGNANGKEGTLYYNLTQGTLAYQEYQHQEGIDGPYMIDNKTQGRQEITGLKVPSLTEIHDLAGGLDYGKLLARSESDDDFQKNIQMSLDTKIKSATRADVDHEYFEKVMLRDITTQKVFKEFMEIDKRGVDYKEISSSTKLNEIRVLYKYIYDSLHRYDTNEIREFQTDIQALIDKKNDPRISQFDPETDMEDELEGGKNGNLSANDENLYLKVHFNARTLSNMTPGENIYAGAKNPYSNLFKKFKGRESGPQSIIDLNSLGAYIDATNETVHYAENNKGARDRTRTGFDKELQSEHETYATSSDLEKAYDDADKA